jgi:hypothetical protein
MLQRVCLIFATSFVLVGLLIIMIEIFYFLIFFHLKDYYEHGHFVGLLSMWWQTQIRLYQRKDIIINFFYEI